MGISRIFYDGCMLSNNPWKTQTTEWRITFMSHKNTMEGPWKSKENFHDQWKFYIIHRIFIILGDPGVVSRAAREKVRRKWKSPWLPTLTGPFPNGQENAGNWLGTKNALYYCAQSANSFSWVLFGSSYTTAIISPHLPGSFTKLS